MVAPAPVGNAPVARGEGERRTAALAVPAPAFHISAMHGILTLNGAARPVPPGQTVATLLDELSLDRRKVAVERNEAIVPRSQYDSTELAPGDQIEIVHFIGGG